MSGSGWESLPDIQEWSGVSLRYSGVVVRPSQMSGRSGRPSRMSGSCRENLPDIQEWSVGPRRYPEVVGRPSRMSVSGLESLPDVW